MQAISKIITISSDNVTIIIKPSIGKCKNIRKFSVTKSKFTKFMGCNCNTLHCSTTTTTRRVIKKKSSIKGTTMMGRLQHQRRINVVGVINRMLGAQNSQLIHW